MINLLLNFKHWTETSFWGKRTLPLVLFDMWNFFLLKCPWYLLGPPVSIWTVRCLRTASGTSPLGVGDRLSPLQPLHLFVMWQSQHSPLKTTAHSKSLSFSFLIQDLGHCWTSEIISNEIYESLFLSNPVYFYTKLYNSRNG